MTDELEKLQRKGTKPTCPHCHATVLSTSQPNLMGTTPELQKMYDRFGGEDLPKPETMLTYASILEKPQYWIDPKTGRKYQMATGEIIEAACAALRHFAALAATPAVGGERATSASPCLNCGCPSDELFCGTCREMGCSIPAAPPAAPLRGREVVILECARLIEENQETYSETADGTRRHLTPRKNGNLAGLAYADGIRALSASPPEQPAAASASMLADIAQIIDAGWKSGQSVAEVAAEILREFDGPVTSTECGMERPSTSAMHDLICAIIEDDAKYDATTNTWDTSKAATAIIAAFDGEPTALPSTDCAKER